MMRTLKRIGHEVWRGLLASGAMYVGPAAYASIQRRATPQPRSHKQYAASGITQIENWLASLHEKGATEA